MSRLSTAFNLVLAFALLTVVYALWAAEMTK
jgi:hypothetical protein